MPLPFFILIICLCAFTKLHAQPERPVVRLDYAHDTAAVISRSETAFGLLHKDPEQALPLIRQSLREGREAGFDYGVAYTLLVLGNYFGISGNYPEAVRAFREALHILPATERGQRLIPQLYNNIANVHTLQADYVQALRYYSEAAMLHGRYQGRSPGLVYNNFGTVLYLAGQPDRALYYLAKAERLGHAAGDTVLTGHILINKGLIAQAGEEYAGAKRDFYSALQLGRAADNAYIRLLASSNLALLAVAEQAPDSALYYIREAENIKTFNTRDNRARLMLIEAEVWYLYGRTGLAERLCLDALNMLEELHLPRRIREAHLLLFRVYRQRGDHEAALRHFVRQTELQDSLNGVTVSANVNVLETRYRTAEKERQIALQQAEIRIKDIWLYIVLAGSFFLFLGMILWYRQLRQQKAMAHLKSMADGEERERARLARELHDGIGGLLAAVRMNLSLVQERHPHIDGLREVAALVGETAAEARKTAHNLLPDALGRYGLKQALQMYCSQIQEGGILQVDLQFLGREFRLDRTSGLLVYRIVQELIQNTIKHAEACLMEIQLIERNGRISIIAEDDGMGFDMTAMREGLGFRNLRYRVKALQGGVRIWSEKGKGTTVDIEFAPEKIKLA